MQLAALFAVLASTVVHHLDIVIMEVSVLTLTLVSGAECRP